MHDDAGAAEEEFPLGPMQAGMLFQALLEPGGGFDIEQLVVHLREPVDLGLLAKAWAEATRRHDSLRLVFRWEGLDRPVQRFLAAHTPEIVQHDWDGLGDEETTARLETLLDSDRRRGFDLTRPPWRVHLCVRGPERVEMLWSVHHLAVDGRSVATLLQEIFGRNDAQRLGRPPRPLPAPRAMADVLRELGRGPAGSFDPTHWTTLLGDKRAPTPLPFAEPATRALEEAGSGAAVVHLDEGTTAGLHALAVQCGATMGAVVHALWALCLARWSGERDVVFGTTRSTRRRGPTGDDADVVGMFINTLPLRVNLDDERTLRELVLAVSRQSQALRGRERDSLVDIARCSGLPPGAPLFESALMFDHRKFQEALRATSEAWKGRGLTVREQPATTLMLTAFDGARLKLRLLYLRRRLRPAVAERIVRHLEALARRMALGPAQRLGDLDTLPEEERRTLLETWNDTARALPGGVRIHEGFEARASAQPDAVAVVVDDASLSYQQLEEAANRLAHRLRQRGAAPGTAVGLCMERGLDLLVGLLGIAKSGAAYVPIDAEYPAERVAFMLRDSGAALAVADRSTRARLGTIDCVELDGADQGALAAMPSTRPAPVGTDTDPCYVIYTSGSTGQPKGVVLAHRAVVNTFDWVSRTFGIGAGDRLLFVTSPCFDLSVYDCFGTLAAGATVEVASAGLLADPAGLAARLTRGDVTMWDSAPQALQRLLPFLPEHAPASRLRVVMLSGDWIPLSLPPAVRRVFPGAAVHSLGGATEAAIWSNWFPVGDIDPRWNSIPYGRPIQNARYHVLDPRRHLVPVGVPGDLYIGGACLAEGYHQRPELTAQRFIADPFQEQEPDGRPARLYRTGDLARWLDDGKLEFLGRADFQVKVRGFRVELGEIETALRALGEVSDAVCVARRDTSGQQSVWAYVTLAPGAGLDVDPAALRRRVAERLPDFMVPAGVLVLDRMPMSKNGKLDRDALPEPATMVAPHTAAPPETPLQRRLVDLWSELLQRTPIGIDDDFFELGGHSLLAVTMVARLKSRLGHDLPVARVLAAPTIRALAGTLEPSHGTQRAGATPREGRLVALSEGGARPPLLLVGGIGGHVFTFRELAALLGPDQPVAAFRAIGAEGDELPRDSVPAVATAYDAELRQLGAKGPVLLGGYSFGTLVAFELAHRLRARGVEVLGLVSIDSFAPGFPQRMPTAERVLDHTKHLLRRDARGRVDYLRERVDNLRRRALFRVGLGHRLAPTVPTEDARTDEQLRRVWAASIAAQRAYRPDFHFPGPMLLFEAAEPFRWPATLPGEPTKGWRHFIDGPIEVLTLPGSHLQLFTPENTRRMAEAIRALELSPRRGGSRGS